VKSARENTPPPSGGGAAQKMTRICPNCIPCASAYSSPFIKKQLNLHILPLSRYIGGKIASLNWQLLVHEHVAIKWTNPKFVDDNELVDVILI